MSAGVESQRESPAQEGGSGWRDCPPLSFLAWVGEREEEEGRRKAGCGGLSLVTAHQQTGGVGAALSIDPQGKRGAWILVMLGRQRQTDRETDSPASRNQAAGWLPAAGFAELSL